MAAALQKGKPVAQTVRRLLRKQLKAACEEVAAAHGAQAVHFHAARKHLKRTRAALRMIRDSISARRFRMVNARSRRVAREFAAIRDAQVLLQTLRKLIRWSPRPLPDAALRPLRRQLQELSRRRVKAARARIHRHANQRQLCSTVRQIDHLNINKRGWRAIEKGLRDTYAKTQAAYLKAAARESDVALHEWRKQTKYVRYQTEFIRETKPRAFVTLVGELSRLTDILGDVQDLHMLRRALATHAFADADGRALRRLRTLAAQRQQQLTARAQALGQQLFADPPAVFVDRLHDYWAAS